MTPQRADYPTDDAYLQAMLLHYRATAKLRPARDQAGHADLPLFQTDLEEFTNASPRR